MIIMIAVPMIKKGGGVVTISDEAGDGCGGGDDDGGSVDYFRLEVAVTPGRPGTNGHEADDMCINFRGLSQLLPRL